jgi:hypothetical protein
MCRVDQSRPWIGDAGHASFAHNGNWRITRSE